AGIDAKPIRVFPAPRQSYLMHAAEDGSLYLAADNIYRVNVQTGEREIAIPVRDWEREGYGQPDVLYLRPKQQVSRDFSILYAAPKCTDERQPLDTAEVVFGFYNVTPKTGETMTRPFAPFTEA